MHPGPAPSSRWQALSDWRPPQASPGCWTLDRQAGRQYPPRANLHHQHSTRATRCSHNHRFDDRRCTAGPVDHVVFGRLPKALRSCSISGISGSSGRIFRQLDDTLSKKVHDVIIRGAARDRDSAHPHLQITGIRGCGYGLGIQRPLDQADDVWRKLLVCKWDSFNHTMGRTLRAPWS